MDIYIYALCEPVTGEVRYIGLTRNPTQRMRSHLASKQKSHKREWIALLQKTGQTPVMKVLEVVDAERAAQCEAEWIAKYRQSGRLVNHSDGFDSTPLYSPTRETREKLSIAQRGKTASIESRLKRSRAMKRISTVSAYPSRTPSREAHFHLKREQSSPHP